MTTVPFARVSSIARLMTAFDFVAAVMRVRVRAVPAGQVANQRLERVRVARACVQAERERASDAFGVEVEADDAASCRLQQLRRDLTDEPQTDDADALAELRRGPPDALQRDGADGRRRRVLQLAARRHAADEIARHAHVVRVVRLPRAGAATRSPDRRSAIPSPTATTSPAAE